VHRWVRRYHSEGGESGLERRPVPGRPRALGRLGEDDLRRLVLAPATRYGFETDLWTVGRLHEVLTRRFGEDVSQDTIWRRVGDARPAAEGAGDRLARQRRGPVGVEPRRPADLPAAREADRLGGGHRVPGSDASPPPGAASGCRDGPSVAAHVEGDDGIHREP